jgi:hypothetical protein
MAHWARRSGETLSNEARVRWSCRRSASAVPTQRLRLISSRRSVATIHGISCQLLTGRGLAAGCCLLLVLWPAAVTSLARAYQDPPVPAPTAERSEQALPHPVAQWRSGNACEVSAPAFVARVPDGLARERATCRVAGLVSLHQPEKRRGVEEWPVFPARRQARLDLRTELLTQTLQRRGNHPAFLGSCPCPVGDLRSDPRQ